MCGIVGVIVKEGFLKNDRASILAAQLLKDIQNRGQDTAGIASIDYTTHLKKDLGLVDAIFCEEEQEADMKTKIHSPLEKIPLSVLPGKLAIGHVRYKTTGGSGKHNAQPFYQEDERLAVTLCHNGHIINYSQIETELLLKGESLQSQNDAEIITKILFNQIKRTDSLFEAAGKTMDQLKGSYSVAAGIYDKNAHEQYLLIFRDAHAIRPCAYGRQEGTAAVASESRALTKSGFEDIRDVLPGEVIVIDTDLQASERIVRDGAPRHCFFEWEYFAKAESIMQGIRVNEIRYQLGEQLARENKDLIEKYDIVIYVPHTSTQAAKGFAKELGLDFQVGIEKDIYGKRNFIKESLQQTIQDTARNLTVFPEIVYGKNVFIIDDSIVKGTASREVIKKTRQAGAKKVGFGSTTPPLKHQCNYGIVMDENLIALERDIEQIREEINADDLRYMSLEGLKRTFKEYKGKQAYPTGTFRPCKPAGPTELCYACVTGEQPIDL